MSRFEHDQNLSPIVGPDKIGLLVIRQLQRDALTVI